MFDFQGMGSSNFAAAGKAAADDTLKSFLAARRNSPNMGQIVQEAAKNKSLVKQAAIAESAKTTMTGMEAKSKVEAFNIRAKTAQAATKSKRKAGVVAAAGQMIGKAGALFEKPTKGVEVGEGSAESRALADSLDEKAKGLRTQSDNWEIPEELRDSNTPKSPGGSTPPANNEDGVNTNLPSVSTATPTRSAAFNEIYDLAKQVGGTNFPEVVAAQAMHETGWLANPNSVYFASGKTNPFGQTGDRGYGTIPRKGFSDGWTIYPDKKTAVKDHIGLWHDTANHGGNYNAFTDRNAAIRSVSEAYSPNSDKENIRLGYTTNGYYKGVTGVLTEVGL